MKTNYQTPQIEVVEIELEGTLCGSGGGSNSSSSTLPSVDDGGGA